MISIWNISLSAPPVPIQNIIEANRLFVELDYCLERELVHKEKLNILETQIGSMQGLLIQAEKTDSIRQAICVNQANQLKELNTRLNKDLTTARQINRVILPATGLLLLILLLR